MRRFSGGSGAGAQARDRALVLNRIIGV